MTTDLEDRIRTHLQDRASRIAVDRPPFDEVLARPETPDLRPRRVTIERVAVAAALLAFVAAGVVVALAGREGSGVSETPPAATAPPTAGPLAEAVAPGALVSMPAPWSLERFFFLSKSAKVATQSGDGTMRDSDGNVVDPPPVETMVEYGFTDGARTVQLNFYPLGLRQPSITTPEPPLVPVRGTTGYFLDYGEGRYRIQWDEGGRTWDVDGYGYASLDELAGVLDTVQIQDDATWMAQAPPGLADAILANPDGSVSWTSADGLDVGFAEPVGR